LKNRFFDSDLGCGLDEFVEKSEYNVFVKDFTVRRADADEI
jgi:hypothetical protein